MYYNMPEQPEGLTNQIRLLYYMKCFHPFCTGSEQYHIIYIYTTVQITEIPNMIKHTNMSPGTISSPSSVG